MAFVTVQHASYTETMRFNVLGDLQLPCCLTLAVFEDDLGFETLNLQHLLVAGLAREDWLVYIAVFISTLSLHVL